MSSERTHLDRVTDLLSGTSFDLKLSTVTSLRMRAIADLDERNVWIQVVARGADGEPQNGRKWWISQHACDSEIVMTALQAWLSYVEHEARESFRFLNTAVASPHWDVKDLVVNPPRMECRT